jgi:hypothetical protein
MGELNVCGLRSNAGSERGTGNSDQIFQFAL